MFRVVNPALVDMLLPQLSQCCVRPRFCKKFFPKLSSAILFSAQQHNYRPML